VKRLALAALAAVFWVGVASAGQYSGITSMTFQNGVAPTSGYTGCADTFIAAAVTDSSKNFGAGDSLKVSSAAWTGNQPGLHRTLLGFDISALPDSAVITQAYLYLYQCLGATGASTDTLHVYRLGKAWVEGSGGNGGTVSTTTARWQCYGTAAQKWAAVGAGLKSHRFRYPAASFGVSVDSAVTASFYGTDTQTTGGANFDVPFVADAMNVLYTGAGTLRQGWQVFDVTHLVRLWHIGQINNEGMLIEQHNTTNNKLFAFWSSSAVVNGLKVYRPKLVVQYFDPTSGTSSGGRRVIGNGAGAIH